MYITFRALFFLCISAIFCVQNKRSKNRKVVSHITYFKHKFFYIYIFFTVGIKIYAANNNKIQPYFSYIRIVYVIYATSCIFHTSATSHIAQCNNNKEHNWNIYLYVNFWVMACQSIPLLLCCCCWGYVRSWNSKKKNVHFSWLL